jgi:hypothetical protein
MKKYIKPKKGDKVICAELEYDEDLGFSGAVIPGLKGIAVGEEYTITSVDFEQVPKRGNTWTEEEYGSVQWYWTLVGLKDKNGKTITVRTFLGSTFKRKND